MPEDICPHCKAPLTGNTVDAETYIEEGYLPRWEAYKKWQTGTLNRRLVILELGEGFKRPAVMRWPFEKIGFFNQKSAFYRVHTTFYQMPKEMGERAVGIEADSVAFIRGLGRGPEKNIRISLSLPCLVNISRSMGFQEVSLANI